MGRPPPPGPSPGRGGSRWPSRSHWSQSASRVERRAWSIRGLPEIPPPQRAGQANGIVEATQLVAQPQLLRPPAGVDPPVGHGQDGGATEMAASRHRVDELVVHVVEESLEDDPFLGGEGAPHAPDVLV